MWWGGGAKASKLETGQWGGSFVLSSSLSSFSSCSCACIYVGVSTSVLVCCCDASQRLPRKARRCHFFYNTCPFPSMTPLSHRTPHRHRHTGKRTSVAAPSREGATASSPCPCVALLLLLFLLFLPLPCFYNKGVRSPPFQALPRPPCLPPPPPPPSILWRSCSLALSQTPKPARKEVCR